MSSTRNKPATARKLAKSRQKGLISRSLDAANFVGTIAALSVLIWFGTEALQRFDRLLDLAITSSDLPLADGLQKVTSVIGNDLFGLFAPLLTVIVAASVLVSIFYQKGFVFAPELILPNLQRMNPVMMIGQICGLRGLARAGQGFARLIVWFAATGILLAVFGPAILASINCGLGCTLEVAFGVIGSLAFAAGVILLVAALVDLRIQHALFQHEQRMSETEQRMERKDNFGSPEIRRARRDRQRDRGASEAIGAARATMCFFSCESCVALRYHPRLSPLPRISAVSTTSSKTIAIRNMVRENGHPELEHAKIVQLLRHLPPGAAVEESQFEALVEAMGQLYSAAR
ncbi:MAG: EscU/YscU/HrcU family type III secretion system export apparatus switch protein [Pseudomonadota bacterium]